MSSTVAFVNAWVHYGSVTAAGAPGPADPHNSALLIVGVLVAAVLMLRASISSLSQSMREMAPLGRMMGGVIRTALLVIGTLVLVIVAVVTSMTR